jgi:hypothetical protein
MQRQHEHASITIEELLGYVFSMCFLFGPCRAYIEEIRKQIREKLVSVISQPVVKLRSRQFSSVENFIVSGECYNWLCFIDLEIVITKCSYYC